MTNTIKKSGRLSKTLDLEKVLRRQRKKVAGYAKQERSEQLKRSKVPKSVLYGDRDAGKMPKLVD